MSSLPYEVTQRINAFLNHHSHQGGRLNLSRLRLTDVDAALIPWDSVAEHALVVDLSNNLLTTLPGQMICLSKTMELSVYKNAIEVIPVGIFVGMRSLQSLLLSDNRLRSLPTDMERLNVLRVLDCSSNRMTQVPHVLPLMKGLQVLQLEANPMTVPEQVEAIKSGTILQYVSSMPAVPMLSFSSLLNATKTSDLHLNIVAKDSSSHVRHLHRCIVSRDPLFRGLNNNDTLGDGRFSIQAWDAVFGFLYGGIYAGRGTDALEVMDLAREHKIESLLCLVERELENQRVQKEQQKKEQKEQKPEEQQQQQQQQEQQKKPEDTLVYLDGCMSLGLHMQSLLLGDVAHCKSDFKIVCSDVDFDGHVSVVPTFAAILEARFEHFRCMLRSDWAETSRHSVEVQFDASCVNSLLEWAYTGSFGTVFDADLVKLLDAAHFLGVPELLFEVQATTGDQLDKDCAFQLLQYVDERNDAYTMLFSMLVTWCKTNWHSCLEMPEFKALPPHLKKLVCA